MNYLFMLDFKDCAELNTIGLIGKRNFNGGWIFKRVEMAWNIIPLFLR